MIAQSVSQARPDPDRAVSPSVRAALSYLLRHCAMRVSVDDMAARAGCTPFQLIRRFRRELGVTPHMALMQIRVRRGTAMLERGHGIASIAVSVGFFDQTHFTKQFKRHHGQTPGQYLARRRSGPDRLHAA